MGVKQTVDFELSYHRSNCDSSVEWMELYLHSPNTL